MSQMGVMIGGQTPEFWTDVIMSELPTTDKERARAIVLRRMTSALEAERKTVLAEVKK